MKKFLSLLFPLFVMVTIPLIVTSCGDDEPATPQTPSNPTNPYPGHEEDPGNNDHGGRDIPGAKILGTWYYLSPDKAFKITINFSSEEGPNYLYTGGRVCYISVESEFPYYYYDYDNVWYYENNNWSITRLEVNKYLFSSATITKVFDEELWLDFEYGLKNERLKFRKSDPGRPVKPYNKELAPDGIFGTYKWKTSIGNYNMSLQFVSSNIVQETSDSEVYVSSLNDWFKESTCEAIFNNGILRLAHDKSIISSKVGNSYFVVTRESDKKLKLYNPFSPDVSYTFSR